MLSGKHTTPLGQHGRPKDRVRDAERNARDKQMPTRLDRQEQQDADGQRPHAEEDHPRGSVPFGQASGEDSGAEGGCTITAEEQPDPLDVHLGGKRPQERAGQPKAHAHSHADQCNRAEAMTPKQ